MVTERRRVHEERRQDFSSPWGHVAGREGLQCLSYISGLRQSGECPYIPINRDKSGGTSASVRPDKASSYFHPP